MIRSIACVALSALATASAHASTTGFVNNAAGNSTDLATYAAGFGASVTTLDFETHPNGTLDGNFYLGSNGVTMTQTTMAVGTGIGALSGSLNSPNSTGEGLHASSSTYVSNTAGNTPFSLTVTFATPVTAAGFMTFDYFNPFADNPLVVEAFDGADGAGTSLGSFSSLALNFQLNYFYFMGIGRSEGDIKSIRLSGIGKYGDGVGIDDVRYTVPAPSIAGLGLVAGLRMARRRR